MADAKAKQVRQFVQGLEREDRYIVLLYYADGLTPVEIARVLDLPSSRVRNRLYELRSALGGVIKRPKPAPQLGIDPLGGPKPAAFA